MEKISSVPTQSRSDPIYPITLDVYRESALTGDGHAYERITVIKWIEEQETSPLVRQPLNINDLRSTENLEQLGQINSVKNPSPINLILVPAAPTIQARIVDKRSITHRQNCNIKHVLLITLCISLIFVFSTSPSNSLHRFTIVRLIYIDHLGKYTDPLTTHDPSNNCTLSHTVQLFFWNNMDRFNYRYYSKLYRAVSTRTMITFAFRNDPSFWCLDDVSVIDTSSKTELLTNGGFEDNPSDGFIRCNPFENSSTALSITSTYPHSGKRSFCDGSVGLSGYLSQTLHTNVGQIYQVSFWLENKDDGSNSAEVLISY